MKCLAKSLTYDKSPTNLKLIILTLQSPPEGNRYNHPIPEHCIIFLCINYLLLLKKKDLKCQPARRREIIVLSVVSQKSILDRLQV